jgi:hypothetical protein
MKVLRASATLDAKAMLDAAELLVPVRDSWVTIASKAAPTIPSLREVSAAEARPRLTHPVVA